MTFFDGPKPRQFAHRGARGTHPENTIVAFEAALEVGTEAFELDVHTSADGEVVVIHDSTLERTTDGRGKVRDLSLGQLRALDAGYNFTLDDGETFPFRGQGLRIPMLAEVLEAFPDVSIIVEIKQDDPPLESQLDTVLQTMDARSRVLVFSLKQGPLNRYREQVPRHQTGFGPNDVAGFMRRVVSKRWDGYEPPGAAFAVPVNWNGIPVVSKAFVRAAHAIDREVFVWTVNEIDEMNALLDLGVDGLISDFPERLCRVIAGRTAVDTPATEA